MDFTIPKELEDYYAELEKFIEAEIIPLEQQDDNVRFFDHRREYARTNFEEGGLPREEWEALLWEAKQRADKAGHWRFTAPTKYGGKDGSNLWMAVIRDRFAQRGLGLHNGAPKSNAKNSSSAGSKERGGSPLASPSPTMALTRPIWKHAL